MFNLVPEVTSVAGYLKDLVTAVRGECRTLKARTTSNSIVGCSIAHTVTFTSEGPVSKATIKYSRSYVKEDGVTPAEYVVKDLFDKDYKSEYLTDLICAAAEDTNRTIDFFTMNSEVMYTDDIVASVDNFITGYLRSVRIEDGFSVQTDVVAGGISQITITVA